MDARASSILRFLDGGDKKFIIPVYQRPYSWKKENCIQLMKDLKAVYQNDYESHFFGSIVFVEEDRAGCNEYTIIDGQQRITTVSILLLAIRNYVLDNNLDININVDKIKKQYLTDEYAHDEKKLKLKLVQGDDESYDVLINNNKSTNTNKIFVNYDFFYNEISKMTVNEIEKLYSAITKLMIVNISLKPQNGDDPQLIFESLNSTGQALEESDKIRNYVLMCLSAYDQERLYRIYWEVLEKKVGKEDTTKFIRHYLAIKLSDLPREDKLYFTFKKYREENCQNLKIEDILTDMLKYADYYNKIKNSKYNDRGFNGVFGRLMYLDVNTAIPLLFHLYDAFNSSLMTNDQMLEACKIVESYYVRRMICGLPAASLNRTYVSIGAEIEKYMAKDNALYIDALKYSVLVRSGKSRFPNDHDFYESFVKYELYNAKSSFRKYIFERLENSSHNERVDVFTQIDSGDLTIEHIMPQTLNSEWIQYLGANYELIHTKYLHTIGNLTLTGYNSDYSNLIYKKKKEMKDKGLNESKLTLNKYFKNCDNWNEDEIIKRSDILFDIAKKLWELPQTDFEHNADEEWVDLDDEYDFTNKTVKKIQFMGDEILTSNITDAFIKVNTELFLLDPDTYLNHNSTHHSNNKNDIRHPVEISKGVYLEKNINSQGKINSLRNIFSHFKLDPQELRFLISIKGSNAEFNIDDESTYYNITCGLLAFNLISNLFIKNKITQDEINLLLTKEYSKTTFNRVAYPVLALSKEANKGNSSKIRYYSDPINYNGVKYFISSQWFDESRDDLIIWYKKINN